MPFVGRANELAAFARAARTVAAGGSAVVLVTGDAGMGKTELIRVGLRAAGYARDHVLLGGAPGPGGRRLPFAAIPRGLRDRLSTGRSRTGQLDAAATWVAKQASRSPLAVVSEDLHWADESSLDLLGFLARSVADVPLLLVLSARTDEPDLDPDWLVWLGELGRLDHVTLIHLPALDGDELASLYAQVVHRPPSARTLDRLRRQSGSNPYLVLEVLAAGEPADVDGHGRASTFDRFLAGRLSLLTPEARSVVDAVAVAGFPVTHGQLCRLLDLPETVVDPMTEAVRRSILRVDEADQSYVFPHALARESAEAQVIPAVRTLLHERCVAVLSQALDPTDPVALGLLADHQARAGLMAEAMSTSWAASRACLAVFAFVEGGEHGERALAMWSSLAAAERGPEALGADLLEHTATCWIRAGHPRRALPLARRAVDLRRTAGADSSDLGRTLGRLGEAALFAGQHLDAAAALDEAADLLESSGPSGVRAEVLALRAELLMLQGLNTEAVALAQRALDESVLLGLESIEGHATNTLGAALSDTPARMAEAVALLRRALAIAERLGDPFEAGRAATNLGAALDLKGEREAAVLLWLAAAERARDYDVWRIFGLEHEGNAGWALMTLGRWEQAASVLARSAGQPVDSVGALGREAVSALLAARLGDADASRASLDRLLPSLTGLRDQQHTTGAICAELEHDVLVGRTSDAYDRAVRAVQFGDVDQLDAATLLAEAAVRASAAHAVRQRQDGHDDTADQVAAFAARVSEWIQALLLSTPGLAGQPHQSVRGLTIAAEAARAAGNDTPDQWREASDQWDALDWPWDAACARLRGAEALIRSSPSARARIRRDLERVRDTAVALGASPLVSEVAAAARRAGVSLADHAGASHDGRGTGGLVPASKTRSRSVPPARPVLTARERQVLALVAAGMTNRQIAQALVISPHTAGVHVSHILTKLGVANRAQAAVVGLRASFVVPEDNENA